MPFVAVDDTKPKFTPVEDDSSPSFVAADKPQFTPVDLPSRKSILNPPGGDLHSEAGPPTPWSMAKEALSFARDEENKMIRDKSRAGLDLLTSHIHDVGSSSFEAARPLYEKAQKAATFLTNLVPDLPGVLNYPKDVLKAGAGFATGMISPESLAFAANLPKAAVEVAGQTSADMLDPVNAAVMAAEPVIAGVKAIPPVEKALAQTAPFFEKIFKEYTPSFYRFFTYRGMEPAGYPAVAEKRIADIQKGVDKAVEIGKNMQENFSPAEQTRIAQIIKGGISTSDARSIIQLPEGGAVGSAEAAKGVATQESLRQTAAVARAAMDGLEQEAVEVGALPKDAFGELTDRALADLRNKKATIDKTITKISRYGAFQQKQALLAKAARVDVVGGAGIKTAIDTAQEQNYQGVKKTIEAGKGVADELVGKMTSLSSALGDAKEHLSGEEFKMFEDILQMEQLRRSKGLQRTFQRYEKLSIGEQEHVFNRLSSLLERLKDPNAAQDVVQTAQAGATAVSKTLGGVDTDKLSVSNLKGLIKQIEDVSGRFPGQKALLRSLSEKSLNIQKEIADSYQMAGKSYMPRLYATKEMEARVPGFSVGGAGKAVLDRLKGREDIPEDMRRAMGEIMTAGYPTAKGLAQMSQAVNTFRMFRSVAENPEWSTADAAEAGIKGFKQLANSRGYGDLAGKFVHPEIYRDIQGVTRNVGDIEKLYTQGLAKWKSFKVIPNPAVHARNMIQNSIMADLGGVDPIKQMTLLPQAIGEVMNKGSYYKELYDAGRLGGTFTANDLGMMRNELLMGKGPIISRIANYSERLATMAEKTGQTGEKLMNRLGAIYQNEEKTFKIMMYIDGRQKGLSVGDAADLMDKWQFDYSKVSPAVKFIRGVPLGSPFITYTAKAIPRIVETAANNPMRIWKYKMLFDAMQEKAIQKGIVTQEEADTIHRTSPNHVAILPMPKDENGNPLTLNISYLVPWGNLDDQSGAWGLPAVATPSGPLMAIVDLIKNNSTFKQAVTGDGRIWMDTDFPGEKLQKGTDYAVKAFLPSLFPGGVKEDSIFKGGYSWEKLISAAEQRPDYYGRLRNPILAALDVFTGLRIVPSDPSAQAGFEVLKKIQQSNEARDQALKVLRSQSYSDKFKAKTGSNYAKKIQRIWEKK